MRKIDESSFLIRLLTNISNTLTRQRGLPIVVGVILITVGGVLEFANVTLESPIIAMFEIAIRTFGIITALVGIALLEPLGT